MTQQLTHPTKSLHLKVMTLTLMNGANLKMFSWTILTDIMS